MLKKIWTRAGSVRMVIPLLIAITLVSLVGVIVPQGTPPVEFYDNGWREALIVYLGLDHLFSTWWFYALLGLLSLNITACSTSRQFANVRKAMTPHFLKRIEDAQALKSSAEFAITAPPEKAAGLFSSHFKRLRYFSASMDYEHGVQVAARSFCFKEIGSLLFHFSILFFFAGGIVGGLRGFSFVKDFCQGEVYAIRDWKYLVRSDWFKIEKNIDGTVSDYTSKLTVLSPDSTPVFSRIIEVNRPLSYKGLRFYQNSFGEQPDAIEKAVLRINGPALGPAEGLQGVFPFNTSVRLPGNGLMLFIKRFIRDFSLEANLGDLMPPLGRPDNPAIRVVLSRGKDTLYDNWSFLNSPVISQNGYTIAFLKFTPRYVTGIKISHNPGAVLIWLGFALMTLGLMLVFYFPHTSYWLFITPAARGSSQVTIGGLSGRSRPVFQEKFNRTCAFLQSLFKEGA
jgi:cytochrome c biogenesis protein